MRTIIPDIEYLTRFGERWGIYKKSNDTIQYSRSYAKLLYKYQTNSIN